MKILDLEDRLYTSTEVAQILGVSLRSVYRYLEDNKLTAEMKTATGRHRFTKQNILDFLSPQEKKVKAEEPVKEEKAETIEVKVVEKEEPKEEVKEEPKEEPKEEAKEDKEDDVDWLAKFRAAAEKYKEEKDEPKEEVKEEAKEDKEEVSGLTSLADEKEEEASTPVKYYKSELGGLKTIAQSIDKSARKASLDYAFTLDAGLSLHKPIKPFSLIHTYARVQDLAFFEKMLELEEVELTKAQLCIIASDDDSIYNDIQEVHGLKVVANAKLKEDLAAAGKEDLAAELD